MNENVFKAGDILSHINPKVLKSNLFVVKQNPDGSYKCRYQCGEIILSDNFEPFELAKPIEKTPLNVKALSGF